jgi:hypothetical protein
MTDHLSITKEEIPRWFRTGDFIELQSALRVGLR